MQGAFDAVSRPLARTFGLVHLPEYFPVIIYSALFFLAVQIISGVVSPLVSPRYKTLPRRTKREWNVKIVSTANILAVLPIALDCFRYHDILARDKAFASHPAALRLVSIAAGYFLWDSVEALTRLDIPFTIHGLSTFFIFVFGLRPFVLYYAPISLMWEISTPFVNIHWFLDKTGHTGGLAQLINGLFLLTAFFCARICYGGWASYHLFKTVYSARNEIPIWVLVVYFVGNIALNVLNWLWFFKMIDALRRRFSKAKNDGR